MIIKYKVDNNKRKSIGIRKRMNNNNSTKSQKEHKHMTLASRKEILIEYASKSILKMRI